MENKGLAFPLAGLNRLFRKGLSQFTDTDLKRGVVVDEIIPSTHFEGNT